MVKTKKTPKIVCKSLPSWLPNHKATKLKNILQINDTKILVIDKESIYRIPIKPNIILLTQSPKINLERVIEELNPAIIIADGSNYKYLLENWQQTCLQKNIPFHSTSEKGYYKIELN